MLFFCCSFCHKDTTFILITKKNINYLRKELIFVEIRFYGTIHPVTFRNVTGFLKRTTARRCRDGRRRKMAKTADPQNQSDTGANIRNRGRFRNDPGCVTNPLITYELKNYGIQIYEIPGTSHDAPGRKSQFIWIKLAQRYNIFFVCKKSGDVTAAGCRKKTELNKYPGQIYSFFDFNVLHAFYGRVRILRNDVYLPILDALRLP